MRAMFTQSFEMQAVEKALNRAAGTGLQEIAEGLGVGYSTLSRWISTATRHEVEPVLTDELASRMSLTKEKRPQDWRVEDRLEMVIACSTLDDEAMSERCRAQGLYPHHVKQWRCDFISGAQVNATAKPQAASNRLRQEIKDLKKELNRKDKALAETAALLVLQKKVNALWGNDADTSQ